MSVRKRVLRLAMLAAAVWMLLPGMDSRAAEGKVRVLEVTRGDYGGGDEDLTPGPQDDGKNFRRMIQEAWGESCVSIVTRDKAGVTTVDGVQKVIQDTFAESRDEDINYFYYSGHGTESGLFLGGREVMSATDLAKGFEGIRGTNILVVDCCYSGVLANRSRSVWPGAGGFADDFVDEFGAAVSARDTGGREARSALTNSKFKLLMASSEEELSWQIGFTIGSGEDRHTISVGGFTMTLCYGCGIDPLEVWDDAATEEDYGLDVISADYDLNGEVSLSEMRRYVENTYHYAANHVRSYPAEDDGCFLPVDSGKEPEITFSSAYINTEKNSLDVRYSADTSVPVDYAVYRGDAEALGKMTYNAINYEEAFSDYDGLAQTACVQGYKNIVAGSRDEYVIRIPLGEDYTDGKYYVALQTEGQELRYLIPFTLATEENTALKEKFQILFSGDRYTAGSAEGSAGTFEAVNGEELTVRADFGSGKNKEEETPYLSCYVYNADGERIRTLGSRELMQAVPEYGSDGITLKAVHYYRNFYWDGKDGDGIPVPADTYYIRVIATGAVSADKMERVVVRRPGEQTGITYLSMSQSEISLPLTGDAEKPNIIFMTNAEGIVTLKLRGAEEDGAADIPLGSYEAVSGRRLAVPWDGMLGEVAAPSGTYVVAAEFTAQDTEQEKMTAVSEPFRVTAEAFAPTVEEIPQEGLQAEFAEGAQSVVLLNYTLNYATTVSAVLYDADGNQAAVLADALKAESGKQQISWDGRIDGKEAVSGTYKLTVSVKNMLTGEMEILVDQVKITVTGLAEPTKPTDPVDPTKPTDPTDPTKPTDPVDPTKPTDPVDPTKPTDPTDPTDPVDPTKPTEPTKPTDPTKPEDQIQQEIPSPGNTDREVLPESVVLQAGTKTVKKITAGVKEKIQLRAVISPENARSQSVTYVSSNKKVASVTSSGKVTAKKAGKAVITATTENGRKTSVTITVKQAPKKITFSAKSKTVKTGKTYKAKVKFPAKTASYQVTFTSSKKSVASVDADGKIKALKKGKTVITAKTFNGKKARMTVTVK